MRNLIYDYYGIYVVSIENHRFTYQQQEYFIYSCPLNEEMLLAHMSRYYAAFQRTQIKPWLVFVRNRYKNYLSSGFVLCRLASTFDLNQLIRLSFTRQGSKTYEGLIKKWITMMDKVENQILPVIYEQSGQFEYLYALTIYYLGFAESALAYLQDYIPMQMGYALSFQSMTLLHLNHDWLNPFYFNFDHCLNTLVRLYQGMYLSIEQIEPYIPYLSFQDRVYLFSFLLYPESFFDELMRFDPKDQASFIRYYKNIEIQEKRIKDFYNMVASNGQIRPLEWL